MSWIGAGIGALLGAQRGGLLGSIIGAVAGNWLEGKAREFLKGAGGDGHGRRVGNGSPDDDDGASGGELATLAAIAAMLSKMAKADGRISEDEVRYCEGVFDRLGLQGEKREYCIRVFRRAKGDAHTIHEYAASFASMQTSARVREIVYGILWDLASADGVISDDELNLLRTVVSPLRIDPDLYWWECNRRGLGDGRQGGGSQAQEDPYSVIGCPRTASDDEVRKAYREKAKQLHPDVLRAQGLSDELISRANAQMARINAAWAEIKKSRNL